MLGRRTCWGAAPRPGGVVDPEPFKNARPCGKLWASVSMVIMADPVVSRRSRQEAPPSSGSARIMFHSIKPVPWT